MDKLGLGVLLYAYATLLGAAYLFGFWRTFGFDIFPFVSPLDYVSAPLNRLLVLMAAPLLLTLIVYGRRNFSGKRTPLDIGFYLVVLYSVGFIWQHFEAIRRFLQYDFHFENEKTVLSIVLIFFLTGIGMAYRIYKHNEGIPAQAIALLLLQIPLSISAGYSDGKAIFNGASNVFFLDNKTLCEEGGVRDWVLVGKFTEHTFFMNTIDKRLCITAEKSYKLISRKYKEGL